MLEILNSDTEVTFNPNKQFQNKLVPFDGEVPSQFLNMNQQQQVPMNPMNHLGAVSPANYDPLMLQQIAPLQTTQNFQSQGMPSNLMTPNGMFSNLSSLGTTRIGGLMGNNVPSPLPGLPGNTIPNPPVPSMPQTPSMPTMPAPNVLNNLGNLSMLGGARLV